MALLNDCKYGYSVRENVLDLNLLRSSTYPDPQADQATHIFTYSLYPHPGDMIAGNVIHTGYELNVPLVVNADCLATSLDPQTAFVEVEAANVIIEAIKLPERGDAIVLRLYETYGATTKTAITFGIEIAEVWETNLLEKPITQLPHERKKAMIELQPFEIVTLTVHPAH